MRWKTVLIAGAIGAIAGYAITQKKNEWVTPEKALKLVKQKASEVYSLSGAWIMVTKEEIDISNIPFTVYKGGFSHAREGDQSVHFEFIADARTGTLLQLIRE